MPHWGRACRGVVCGVVVAVLAGVEDGGEGLEGGVCDLDGDGCQLAWLVPQDGEVECGEQAGFELVGEAGEDVAEVREFVEQCGVCGFGGGCCEGG